MSKSDLTADLAEILETVARDGLPGPRDLDVALDAILCTLKDHGWQGPAETGDPA